MIARSRTKSVVFSQPFLLKGVDRVLPPGSYRVVTDEELIEGVSFPVYRRVATMIFVPAQSPSSIEMVAIDPRDLQAAQDRDGTKHQVPAEESNRPSSKSWELAQRSPISGRGAQS